MENNILFRDLGPVEAADFRQWAWDEYAANYAPGDIMPSKPGVYHPVVNEQIDYINEKARAAHQCVELIKKELNNGRAQELLAFLMDKPHLMDLKKFARGDYV